MSRLYAITLALTIGCGGARSADTGGAAGLATIEPAPRAGPVTDGSGKAKTTKKKDPDDDLFAKRKRGWKPVKAAQRAEIARFADDYAAFLGQAKTPRRVVRRLVDAFKTAGATELGDEARIAKASGKRFWFTGYGGATAAFVMVGDRPIEEGMRIIIAAVDAAHIDLKQQPVYSKAGFAMLDTNLYGNLDLKSWLSHPLALYLHASRPGAADGDLEIVVGESADDPVFVIPDLLPHLSRKVQRKKIVDSAERMDAIAAKSRKALIEFLRGRGFAERDFATSEVSLLPAGPPSFIGLDRGLLAGYGHNHRAMAFAAVRALAKATSAHRTAVVILVSKRHTGYSGSSGHAFVGTALTRIISAMAAAGADADMLATRRIYARSAALIATDHGGKRNQGLVINPRGDDSLPAASRRVLDLLEQTGAQFQIVATSNWSSPARALGTLDLDIIGIGLPVTGQRSPLELVSTLDLYQALVASAGWLTRP